MLALPGGAKAPDHESEHWGPTRGPHMCEGCTHPPRTYRWEHHVSLTNRKYFKYIHLINQIKIQVLLFIHLFSISRFRNKL